MGERDGGRPHRRRKRGGHLTFLEEMIEYCWRPLTFHAFQCHRNASLFRLNLFRNITTLSGIHHQVGTWAISLSCFNPPVLESEVLGILLYVVERSQTLSLPDTFSWVNFAP